VPTIKSTTYGEGPRFLCSPLLPLIRLIPLRFVVRLLAWRSSSCTTLTFSPLAIRRVEHVCRKVGVDERFDQINAAYPFPFWCSCLPLASWGSRGASESPQIHSIRPVRLVIVAGGTGAVSVRSCASPTHRTDGALQGGEVSTSNLGIASLGLLTEYMGACS